MTVSFAWHGAFTNTEVNVLHAEAFETRVFSSEEWDWSALTERFSLGWVTARLGRDLVGFVNVLADGLVHAWLQDVMVAASARGQGIGAGLVAEARAACVVAGYEWLHVDFTEELKPFYLERCGFTATPAGTIRLA